MERFSSTARATACSRLIEKARVAPPSRSGPRSGRSTPAYAVGPAMVSSSARRSGVNSRSEVLRVSVIGEGDDWASASSRWAEVMIEA
ncbi:MAG: hypothetical protein R3B46_00165 [Phycisphaerales bacterium]